MKRAIAAASLCFAATGAQADVFGLLNGRTANILSEPQTTVEAGFVSADDFTTFGGRLNFKLSPNSLFYGTIANIDADNQEDEIAFGGGVVYQLTQNSRNNFDVAIKGSYHLWSTETFLGRDADFSDFGLELILSPKGQALAQGVGIYASIGFHKLSSDVDLGIFGNAEQSDSEISFGLGATLAAGPGEAYAAFENIEDTYIGFGYRLALGQ
ncbi:MAG: hypothetical protein ACPGSC_14520 [Granulosicoccaceae bacterium]